MLTHELQNKFLTLIKQQNYRNIPRGIFRTNHTRIRCVQLNKIDEEKTLIL